MEHFLFNPTPEQRANLERLAAHLDLGVTNLEFDMGCYQSNGTENYDFADECGTVGCAAGHGPSLGIAPLEDEQWDGYIARVFGVKDCSRDWRWLFGSHWVMRDNTPRGAAARIHYALKHGIPENYIEQMTREESLCYTVSEFPEHTVQAKEAV